MKLEYCVSIDLRSMFLVLQLQMKHTWYYIAVGLLMIGSFLVSRVLVFPFLYWRYAVYAGLPLGQVPVHIPLKCNLGCLLILVPQLYWLFLMVRGASKVFYKIYLKSKQHWPKNKVLKTTMCYWLVIQIVMHVINCSLTYLTLISIHMTLYNVEGMPQDVVTFLVWQICKGCVDQYNVI